jgi:hypothetical protein
MSLVRPHPLSGPLPGSGERPAKPLPGRGEKPGETVTLERGKTGPNRCRGTGEHRSRTVARQQGNTGPAIAWKQGKTCSTDFEKTLFFRGWMGSQRVDLGRLRGPARARPLSTCLRGPVRTFVFRPPDLCYKPPNAHISQRRRKSAHTIVVTAGREPRLRANATSSTAPVCRSRCGANTCVCRAETRLGGRPVRSRG